jgi:magnesium-protoporphyrin O-methyltransferase
MASEASDRARKALVKNCEFRRSDLESLDGIYNTVTCIDVLIHYPDEKLDTMVGKLGSLASERLIISFAPKTVFYEFLKKIGE